MPEQTLQNYLHKAKRARDQSAAHTLQTTGCFMKNEINILVFSSPSQSRSNFRPENDNGIHIPYIAWSKFHRE